MAEPKTEFVVGGQNFELKYNDRGVRLEVIAETMEDGGVLMARVEKAARGPKLNMCLGGRTRIPGGYGFTLVLNTDEDMETIAARCKEAVCEGGALHKSCVVMGGELTPEETRDFFAKVRKMAEEAVRRR
jgi:hypothetical protein